MTTEPQHDDAPHRVTSVVHHLVHCRPCRSSLSTMGKREAAVAFLEAQANDMPAAGETTVDRVLRRTAFAGKAVFCDLVYELAKACLLSDEEFARLVKPVVAPRDAEIVQAELDETAKRVATLGDDLASACEGVPNASANLHELRSVGAQLLAVLLRLEGNSPRYELVRSHALISAGDAEEACRILEALLERPGTSRDEKYMATIGLVRVAFVAARHSEVVAAAQKARSKGFSGPMLEMYEIASLTRLGNRTAATDKIDAFALTRHSWRDAERSSAQLIKAFISQELGIESALLSSKVGV